MLTKHRDECLQFNPENHLLIKPAFLFLLIEYKFRGFFFLSLAVFVRALFLHVDDCKSVRVAME